MPQPTKIRLYSTSTCPFCKMEKSWLEKNNVAFDFVLVDEDESEARHMVESTGQMGVPVTELHYAGAKPEYVIGFDRAKLADRLGLANV